MYNGRWRTLIIGEVVVLLLLLLLIVTMLVYVVTVDKRFAVSWATLGMAGAGILGETVRRFRHLRTDLAKYPPAHPDTERRQ